MPDCISDMQLALLGLSLWSGVLLGLRPTWPEVTECFIAETAKGCDMDTLFKEEAASPPGKYCARPISGMGDSPRAVSNQRKGSRFPA